MSNNNIKSTLAPFFHDSIINYIEGLIMLYKVEFVLSKPRKTKLGDYRAIPLKSRFVITVNNDLNPVQFLITSLHELAHHITFTKYKNLVKPHGKEWKQEYQRIFMPLILNDNVEDSLKKMFAAHIKNPKATSYSDVNLNNYLISTFNQSTKRVADAPMNKPFKLGKRTFLKEKKLRTRYLCVDLNNNKKYLIHGSTELE
jgi:hypothetical protein